MTPDDPNSYSQAEIVRLLQTVSRDVGNLREDIRAERGMYVSRAEWDLWKTSNERPKTSGWAVAGVIVSAIVGLGSLLSITIVLIQTVR